jgi:hypothetical protein
MAQRRVIYDQSPKPTGIVVIGEATPSFPEDFQHRLQALDKDLLIIWHRPPHLPPHRHGVWKIEICLRHHGKGYDFKGLPLHDHTCQRGYVLMCQDAEGTPMPLGDWIFEKLREMRHNWETLGGNTDRGVKNAIAESDRIEHEMTQKREAASEDVKRYNRKDKRIQINKLVHLVQQHDLRPNK